MRTRVADETSGHVHARGRRHTIDVCPCRASTNHHCPRIVGQLHRVAAHINKYSAVRHREARDGVPTALHSGSDTMPRARDNRVSNISCRQTVHNTARKPVNRPVPHRPSDVVRRITERDDLTVVDAGTKVIKEPP